MKNTALIAVVFALPLVLAAFAVGWTLSGIETGGSRAAPPQPVSSTAPTEETTPRVVVGEDVPGSDIAELPRPPDSTRIGYRQERLDGFTRTRAEYLTEVGPEEAREFYRGNFASGDWVVADLGFSPEEWYFFVVKDDQEALVEIHALRTPVVVEIELTSPDETSAGNAPAPQSDAPAPAPVPQYGGDDDGDDELDDYYEGGDD